MSYTLGLITWSSKRLRRQTDIEWSIKSKQYLPTYLNTNHCIGGDYLSRLKYFASASNNRLNAYHHQRKEEFEIKKFLSHFLHSFLKGFSFLFFLCLIENSLFPIKPFISWMKFARSFLQFSKTIHHFAVSALTTHSSIKYFVILFRRQFGLDNSKMFDIFYIQLDHPLALSLCYSFVLVYIRTINQLLASIWTLSTLSLVLPFYKLDSLREFQIKLTKAAII